METIDAIKNRQWAPDSWRKQESLQMATYDDQVAYGAVLYSGPKRAYVACRDYANFNICYEHSHMRLCYV